MRTSKVLLFALLPALASGQAHRGVPLLRALDVALGAGHASASLGHRCAVLEDHRVACWGLAARGQAGETLTERAARERSPGAPSPEWRDAPGLLEGLDHVSRVVAGDEFTCALRDDHTVHCWGRNDDGELGRGTRDFALRSVPALAGLRSLSLTWNGGCGVSPQRAVPVCWGEVFAPGSREAREVRALRGAQGVAVYGATAAAWLEDGSVYAWGSAPPRAVGTEEQAGSEPRLWRLLLPSPHQGAPPARAAALHLGSYGPCVVDRVTHEALCPSFELSELRAVLQGAVAAETGNGFGCALDAAGSVYCFGANYEGVLGHPSATQGPASEPLARVPLPSPAASLATREERACALLRDGAVYCWGSNRQGAFGDGGPSRQRPARIDALPEDRAVALALGATHTCVLTDHGRVACAGGNGLGQLGVGEGLDAPSLARFVPLPAPALSLACADHYCCASGASEGWCWGRVPAPFGAPAGSSTPAPVVGLEDVRALSAQGGHACALRSDGSVWCWGHNDEGELGDGTRLSRATPTRLEGLRARSLLALRFGGCARTERGEARCWGNNNYEQLGPSAARYASPPVALPLRRPATELLGSDYTVCATSARSPRAECGGLLFGLRSDPAARGVGFPPVDLEGYGRARSLLVLHDLVWSLDGAGTLRRNARFLGANHVAPGGWERAEALPERWVPESLRGATEGVCVQNARREWWCVGRGASVALGGRRYCLRQGEWAETEQNPRDACDALTPMAALGATLPAASR